MYERMALKWVLEHQFNFLRALLFVIMDLTSEVSTVPLVFMFSLSPLGVHVFSQSIGGCSVLTVVGNTANST